MNEVFSYTGVLFNGRDASAVEDVLAVEETLRISINDVPFTITMRSPGSEEDLVTGLLFTEGIYRSAGQPMMEVTERNESGVITAMNIRIPEDELLKSFEGSRSIASASSCGLCGKTELEELIAQTPRNFVMEPSLIASCFEKVSQQQLAFQKSGGTHAAGAFTRTGDVLCVREDIGRHNAVDKVIGALIRAGKLQEADGVTVSGRISYEIVSKAMNAGIPLLASVSAPSGKAVQTAMEAGMTILAFCRNERFTAYTNPQRLLLNEFKS
jgi:FdhD protein